MFLERRTFHPKPTAWSGVKRVSSTAYYLTTHTLMYTPVLVYSQDLRILFNVTTRARTHSQVCSRVCLFYFLFYYLLIGFNVSKCPHDGDIKRAGGALSILYYKEEDNMGLSRIEAIWVVSPSWVGRIKCGFPHRVPQPPVWVQWVSDPVCWRSGSCSSHRCDWPGRPPLG